MRKVVARLPAARLAAERLRVIVHETINLMKNLIIVGGTAGVGKTTTCRELQKILPRNVFLDGDWCWDMHPFVVTDETKAMVESNIAHLLNGFLACSEFENVIFCWVLHEQHILDDLINALNLNGCTTHCFSLVSTEQALVERLNRDIAAGKRGSDITERSVARISLYDELDTVKIDVSTISPADAARRITEHMAGVQARGAAVRGRPPDRARWVARYRESGLDGLADRSHRTTIGTRRTSKTGKPLHSCRHRL